MLLQSLLKGNTEFPALWSLVVLTSPAVLKTVAYFMIDIPTLFFTVLLLYFRQRPFLLLLIYPLSMLTKEVFILYAAVFFHDFIASKNWRYAALVWVGIFLFVGVRLHFKDDPLSVNYGWKLSEGDFRLTYLATRVESLKAVLLTLAKIAYTLSPLVFLAFKVKRVSWQGLRAFVLNHWGMLAFALAVILSGLMLSSRLLRPWIIVTPVLVYLVVRYAPVPAKRAD